MGDAYRDDLAAAKARVADLEREHTALAARNAALQAAAAPVPARHSRRTMTGGEFVVYVVVCAAAIGLFLLVGGPESAVTPLLVVVALGTQALIKKLRTPIPLALPLAREQPAISSVSEAEANRARLAAALKREADEKAARERAEQDERTQPALAKEEQ